MKTFILAASLLTFLAGTSAYAADPSCDAQAAEKKLAGAAKNSFLKKCAKGAAPTSPKDGCAVQAETKKLAGAAKNSFLKKCEKDSAK